MPTAVRSTSSPAASTASFSLPRRLERIRPRHSPSIGKARIAGAIDQLSRTQPRVQLSERADLGGGGSLREMNRPQILRMFKAGRGQELGQRMQRRVVIIVD